jgi:16S rRNA (guanine966-N2)-methyltransferase
MALKICGGSLRGRLLAAPKGDQTRPTSSQVRAALFNILGQSCTDWMVLDLFAGSGAMGVEALSRGAKSACFVESHRLALQALRKNIDDLGLKDHSQVFPLPVQQALGRCRGPFDLVIADPPYHLMIDGVSAGEWVARRLDEADLVAPAGWVVIEAASPPPDFPLRRLELKEVRSYGDTCLWMLRMRFEERQGQE